MPREGYAALFNTGDIVPAHRIGLEITGIMEMSSGNIAIINDRHIRPGQKVGDLHIIEINMSHLVVDLGDGVVVNVTY